MELVCRVGHLVLNIYLTLAKNQKLMRWFGFKHWKVSLIVILLEARKTLYIAIGVQVEDLGKEVSRLVLTQIVSTIFQKHFYLFSWHICSYL